MDNGQTRTGTAGGADACAQHQGRSVGATGVKIAGIAAHWGMTAKFLNTVPRDAHSAGLRAWKMSFFTASLGVTVNMHRVADS